MKIKMKMKMKIKMGGGGVKKTKTKQGGGQKKLLKSFLAAVLLSASVERFNVSRMRDFFCPF